MILETIKGGMDENLTYVLGCPDTKIGAVVDAAIGPDPILAAREKHDLLLPYLLITHSHPDHLTGAIDLLDALDPTPLVVGWGDTLPGRLRLDDDRYVSLEDEERFWIGHRSFRALHTPGHAGDHICLYFERDRLLFSGDVLFVGRTGRTRMPGQSTETLYRSIERHIAPLPDDVTIYPGHDYGPTPTDTLGQQRETNAFLQAGSKAEFVKVMEEYEASR